MLKLKSIEGLDQAREIENIEEIKLYGIVGQEYQDMVDNSGRIGYVIACAENAKAAQKACDASIEQIKAIYE